MGKNSDEGLPAEIIHLFGQEANTHEGLRLILAFVRIPDPAVRMALVQLVERIADPADVRPQPE